MTRPDLIAVEGDVDASYAGTTLEDASLFDDDRLVASDRATIGSSDLDGDAGELRLVWVAEDGARSQILSRHRFDVR